MIRAAWVGIVTVAATLLFGSIALGASLLRRRGPVYSWATQQWSRSIVAASGSRVDVHGGRHLVCGKARVVVANHASWFDVFALAAVLPIPFYFVAKKELEAIPFFGPAWKAAGHVSIDRSNRQSALASLQRAGERVRRDGGTVVIFPEGTRSHDGQLQPFKRGAFVLAVEAALPVVPVAVVGSREVMPAGEWRIRRGQIVLRCGAPIATAEYDAQSVDRLSERVRHALQRLLTPDAGAVGLALSESPPSVPAARPRAEGPQTG